MTTMQRAVQTKMRQAVGANASVQAVVGLSLNQVVSKGGALDAGNVSADTAWISPRTELSAPVTVNMVLAEGTVPNGSTVSVVREHNGALEVIDSSYNAATRTLSVPSDMFSDFAIVTTPATQAAAAAPAAQATPTATLAKTDDGT